MQYNLKQPFEGLLGEWIDTKIYVNNAIFICSKCNIIWQSNNGTFYNKENCPNKKCNALCQSIYIWYNNTNFSNDIINKFPNKLIPYNQNNGIWIRSIEYKSFGIFECSKCKLNKKFIRWTSAYANSKYEQQCKKCKNHYFPKFMWINHTNETNNKNNTEQQDTHLSALCGACRDNNCKYTNSNTIY